MAKSRKRQPKALPQLKETDPTILSLAESAWGQVDQVRKSAVKLHLWLMTIVSLAQPYAVGWFDDTDTLPHEPWQFYWAVLKIAAPLTIGLSIWACLLIVGWPNDSEAGYLMFMALIGALILTAAAHVGNWLGAKHVDLVEPIQIFNPINGLLNALISYLLAYRGTLFISSVGIATYAGYLMHRYLYGRSTEKDKIAAVDAADERRAA